MAPPLADRAGRRVRHLAGAVVGDAPAPDDAVDGVAVGERPLQPLEDHGHDAGAADRAVGAGVEGRRRPLLERIDPFT